MGQDLGDSDMDDRGAGRNRQMERCKQKFDETMA